MTATARRYEWGVWALALTLAWNPTGTQFSRITAARLLDGCRVMGR